MKVVVEKKDIKKYCEKNGAYQVWLSWKGKMAEQNEEIKEHQKQWSTLPERDKKLDGQIAFNVICDFLIWLSIKQNHYQD